MELGTAFENVPRVGFQLGFVFVFIALNFRQRRWLRAMHDTVTAVDAVWISKIGSSGLGLGTRRGGDG